MQWYAALHGAFDLEVTMRYIPIRAVHAPVHAVRRDAYSTYGTRNIMMTDRRRWGTATRVELMMMMWFSQTYRYALLDGAILTG
jgi:hypothetical protein